MVDQRVLVNKTMRQVVQQLGVRRRQPADTKVVDRGDDSAAHQVLPDPIDGDAGGQRIVGMNEPLGQLSSSALVGIDGLHIGQVVDDG